MSRVTPATVADCDPELDQAIQELEYVVKRYRDLGRSFLAAYSDPERYREVAAIKAERADMFERIAFRASKMKIEPVEALIRIVEVAAPLTRARGRKRVSPTMNAVLANVRDAEVHATRFAEEAHIEAAVAEHAARRSAQTVAAFGAGREYLEASLG